MTHEPVRLLHDAAVGAALRRDLGAVARVDAGYDVSAGLARFESNLSQGAAVARAGGVSGGTIAGAAVLLAGGLAAALFVMLPGTAPAPTADTVARAALEAPVAAPAPFVAPLAPEAAEADAVLLDREPTPETPAAKARRPRPKAAPAKLPDKPAPGDALREARDLQAARSQLGHDAARALELAEAGRIEFRGGTFEQEWEGVAILALFELGRPEARARGEAFLATYPSGTYAPRVRQALGQ